MLVEPERDDGVAAAMSSVAAPSTPVDVAVLVARGAFEDFWRRLRHDYLALVAACFIVVVIVAARRRRG